MNFFSQFAADHADLNPAPFWFLNDRLDPQEMRRQVRLMAEQRVGGFFLHARMGRQTAYLSDEWFLAIDAAIDEAKKTGLGVWIYDEDNWPSGYAGGAVLQSGEWTHQRFLRFTEYETQPTVLINPYDGILAMYEIAGRESLEPRVVRIDPSTVANTNSTKRYKPSSGDPRTILVVAREIHRGRREFCPEEVVQGYVDVFNPAVTDLFIQTTYEEYYRRYQTYFGNTIRGFFFDEPQYHELGLWENDTIRFPFSEQFPDAYSLSTGRELMVDAPWLWLEGPSSPDVRYSFYRMLAEQFRNNFTRRLSTWCSDHKVHLTGHVILEEHPRMAVRSIGDPMLHYLDPDVPGIDHLGKDLDLKMFWSSSHVLCKQVQSAANQLGRNRVMCETFAGGTNFFGPTEQKWMGDWMHALGVTFLCYHAAHYSLRGYRKRDYPPVLHYQQPWFSLSAPLNTHFGRLSWALSQGRRKVSFLLIHPMESFFQSQSNTDFEGNDSLSRTFKTVTEQLVHSGYDWDFGNEEYIQNHSTQQSGVLRIGAADYTTIIIPPILRLRDSTIETLRAFSESGGRILALRSHEVPHVSFPWGDLVHNTIEIDDSGDWIGELVEFLSAHGQYPFLKAEKSQMNSLVFQERKIGQDSIVFIASSSKQPLEYHITLTTAKQRVYQLDTVSGEARILIDYGIESTTSLPEIDFRVRVGGTLSTLLLLTDETSTLRSTGNRTMIDLEESNPAASITHSTVPQRRTILLNREISVPIQCLQPNAIILDHVTGTWGAQEFDTQLTIDVMRSRIAKRSDFGRPNDAEPCVMTYSFRSLCPLPAGSVSFAVEDHGQYGDIRCDGKSIKQRDVRNCDWIIDPAFTLISVPFDLAPGDHQFTIAGELSPNVEIEPVYLIGNFSVGAKKVDEIPGSPTLHALSHPIINEPKHTLRSGSWTDQGYPFYAGAIQYQFSWKCREKPRHAFLRFGNVTDKDSRRIVVNGSQIGVFPFGPFDVEITEFMRSGVNRIDVEVATHLRNFLGPHHVMTEDEVDCFSPSDHFQSDEQDDVYLVRTSGILGEVWLDWR